MATKKKIVISCKPDGSVKLEGAGFSGTECNAAMKGFEQAMGKPTGRGIKPDMQNQGRVNVQNV
jgi:hypothetical protein